MEMDMEYGVWRWSMDMGYEYGDGVWRIDAGAIFTINSQYTISNFDTAFGVTIIRGFLCAPG